VLKTIDEILDKTKQNMQEKWRREEISSECLSSLPGVIDGLGDSAAGKQPQNAIPWNVLNNQAMLFDWRRSVTEISKMLFE